MLPISLKEVSGSIAPAGHGPGGLFSSPALGGARVRRKSKRAQRRMSLKAPNYSAHAGETITGNLGRGAGGQFVSAGSGGGSNPKVFGKSEDEKKRDEADKRRTKRDKTADATARQLGIASGDLGALRSAAEGESANSAALERLGLLADGEITPSGRRALSALERGDTRAYAAALQVAKRRQESEQARGDRARARDEAKRERQAQREDRRQPKEDAPSKADARRAAQEAQREARADVARRLGISRDQERRAAREARRQEQEQAAESKRIQAELRQAQIAKRRALAKRAAEEKKRAQEEQRQADRERLALDKEEQKRQVAAERENAKKRAAEEKKQQAEQTARDTADKVGLGSVGLDALRGVAEGADVDPRYGAALESIGLAVRVGNSYEATNEGRRALSSVEKGDVRGWQAAMQQARAQVQRQATGKTIALKHGKHDQSSHGRKGARGQARAATYAAVRAGGGTSQEARAAANNVSEIYRLRQRQANIDRQLQGEISDKQRSSLGAERDRIVNRAARLAASVPESAAEHANTAYSHNPTPTVRGRKGALYEHEGNMMAARARAQETRNRLEDARRRLQWDEDTIQQAAGTSTAMRRQYERTRNESRQEVKRLENDLKGYEKWERDSQRAYEKERARIDRAQTAAAARATVRPVSGSDLKPTLPPARESPSFSVQRSLMGMDSGATRYRYGKNEGGTRMTPGQFAAIARDIEYIKNRIREEGYEPPEVDLTPPKWAHRLGVPTLKTLRLLSLHLDLLRLKHGKHDQSTHGRKGRAGQAGAAAYQAARAEGQGHREALALQKEATAAERRAMLEERRAGRATPAVAPAGPLKTTGDDTRAYGADPNQSYTLQHKLVDMADLKASNLANGAINPAYDPALQPRDRSRAASQAQIDGVARNLNADVLVTDFHRIDSGSPITDSAGNILSGNGRTLALQRANELHPEVAAAYRERLKQEAQRLGIDPRAVDQMQNPVLVRELKGGADPVAFAREANSSGTLRMSPLEQAKVDAQTMADRSVLRLNVKPEQNIDQALRDPGNKAFLNEFLATVPDNERATLLTRNGELNQMGLYRAKAALYTKAFPGESGSRLAESMLESLDPEVKTIQNGISSSLPSISRATAMLRSGERARDLDLSEDFAKTIDVYARIKDNPALTANTPANRLIDKYLGQSQMFDRELTPDQEVLLRHIDSISRKPNAVRDLFNRWADLVENQPPPGQSSLFGDDPLTKRGLIDLLVGGNASNEPAQQGLF